MRLAGTIATLLAAAAMCLPAAAGAATRHVAEGGSDAANDCTEAGNPCATIQHAVDEATDGDGVSIAVGTYQESVVSEKVLVFNGKGAGATIVRGLDGAEDEAGRPAFDLRRGAQLWSLRAEGGDAGEEDALAGQPGGDAVVYEPEGPADPEGLLLLGVEAEGGLGRSGAPGGDGLAVSSAAAIGDITVSIFDGAFSGAPGIEAPPSAGLRAEGAGTSVSASASTMSSEGFDGAAVVASDDAGVTIGTSDLEGPRGASAAGASLTLVQSSVLASGPRGVEAIQSGGAGAEVEIVNSLVAAFGTAASIQTSAAGEPASLEARGATLVSAGTAVRAQKSEDDDAPATAVLANTIARDLSASEPVDLNAAGGGSIEASFSSFTTVDDNDAGVVSEPGSGGNVAGDPEFLAPNNGSPGAGNYRLPPSSPLIDAGDAASVTPGQPDLAGNTRSLDGNEDCIVAPDIGAYELTGHEVTCDAPGDDSSDEDAPRTSSPPDFSFAAATLPVAPVSILDFSATNRVFAPTGGKARAAARRAKRGTRFVYRLSRPAQVTIGVIAAARTRKRLRRSLRRCQRRAPNRRARKRCRRYAIAARLAPKRVARRGSVFFDGRRGRKPLFPGVYVASIVAREGRTLSQPARLRIRIVRG